MQKVLIITFVLIIWFSSCTSPKYLIKPASTISPDALDHTTLIYTPVADSLLKASELLNSTCILLDQKKYGKLNNYLEQVKNETPDYFLAKTFYYISKKEYPEAIQLLNKIDDRQYQLLKELLSIDLDYEIARLAEGKNYKKFLQQYQAFIDKYPDHDQLKKAVAMRVRYIRYNY
jgi:tetratricopeptide (TPR) repeat protein